MYDIPLDRSFLQLSNGIRHVMPSTDKARINSKGIDGSAHLTAGCVLQWVKIYDSYPSFRIERKWTVALCKKYGWTIHFMSTVGKGTVKGHVRVGCKFQSFLVSEKWHLFKVGPVNSPKGDRCKQALKTDSYVLCDCEALATLRFRHPDRHLMKPRDFEDVSVSKILHCAQVAGLLDAWTEGLHKRSITVKVHGPLSACLSEFYCILSAVQKDPIPCTYLPGLILCLDKCVFILRLKHHEQRLGWWMWGRIFE